MKVSQKLLELQNSIILLHSRTDEPSVIGSIAGAIIAIRLLSSDDFEQCVMDTLFDEFVKDYSNEKLTIHGKYIAMMDNISIAILAARNTEDKYGEE